MNENIDSNDEKKESSKPKYWKRFWIAVIISYIGTIIFSLLFFQTNIIRTLLLGLIFGIAIGIAYYIRIKPSLKTNKILYIMFGVTPIGFGLWLLYGLTGMSRFLISLGSWYIRLNILIMISIFVIGGLIGNWIGKKKDYRIPFSLK